MMLTAALVTDRISKLRGPGTTGERKDGGPGTELRSVSFQVKTYTFEGKPYREINRLATEEDVALIVMGCHGMDWVEGMLWGSVSQRVAEYSEKPVLLVK